MKASKLTSDELVLELWTSTANWLAPCFNALTGTEMVWYTISAVPEIPDLATVSLVIVPLGMLIRWIS